MQSRAKLIEYWCKKKVDDIEKEIVNDLSKDIERTTRLNFNRASMLIPAKDNYIDVFSRVGDKSFTIVCGGTQVLFVEFGAGIAHSTETSTVLTDDRNRQIEYASRPAGIYPIGGYGKGYGKNDSWIFKDINYVPDTGRNHTHLIRENANGEFIYRTSGIKPVRALYLAVSSGVKKLASRQLRRSSK